MITEDWNEELGLAQCVFTDISNGVILSGYGRAICHDDDIPWKRASTGKYIAMTRAQIDILRKKRDYELKPSIMAIEHIISTMTNSKRYNPDSYEAKRIKKELKNLKDDLHMINTIIKDEQASLKTYLDTKDKLHKKDENK
jgi:hypothetical protein